MAQTKTKLLDKMLVKDCTKDSIEKKLGRALSNPINAKKEGENFTVTLTGEIQFSQYGDRKSAHLLTKEGFKISVPSNFDKTIHKANETFECVCMVAEVKDENGKDRAVKYSAFA